MRLLLSALAASLLISTVWSQERLWSYSVQPLRLPAGIDVRNLAVNRIGTDGAFPFRSHLRDRLYTWDPSGGFVEHTNSAIASVPGLASNPQFIIQDVTSAGDVLFGLTGDDAQGALVFGRFLLNIQSGDLDPVNLAPIPGSTTLRANGLGQVAVLSGLPFSPEIGIWQAGSYTALPEFTGRVLVRNNGFAVEIDDTGKLWCVANDAVGGTSYSWGYFQSGLFTPISPVDTTTFPFFPFGVAAHDGSGSLFRPNGVSLQLSVSRGTESRLLATSANYAILGGGTTLRHDNFGSLEIELFDGTRLDFPSMWRRNTFLRISGTNPAGPGRNWGLVGASDNSVLLGPGYFDVNGESADYLLLKRRARPALHVACEASVVSLDDMGLRVVQSGTVRFRVRGGLPGERIALTSRPTGTGSGPLLAPIWTGLVDDEGEFVVDVPDVESGALLSVRAVASDPTFGVVSAPSIRIEAL